LIGWHLSVPKPVRVLAYLWASPCTVIGGVAGLVAALFGAQLRLHLGLLEVTLLPTTKETQATEATQENQGQRLTPAARWPFAARFAAITLGHVVLASDAQQMQLLRVHERAHVAQYERWGPLFLLAYPLSSLVQLLRGRHPYFDNHFEVQARAVEAQAPSHSPA
jgi:hypothetical protein